MAHKKAGGSSRNGRDSNPKYLGREDATAASRGCRATSSCVSAAPSSIRARASAWAATTRFMRSSAVMSASRLDVRGRQVIWVKPMADGGGGITGRSTYRPHPGMKRDGGPKF